VYQVCKFLSREFCKIHLSWKLSVWDKQTNKKYVIQIWRKIIFPLILFHWLIYSALSFWHGKKKKLLNCAKIFIFPRAAFLSILFSKLKQKSRHLLFLWPIKSARLFTQIYNVSGLKGTSWSPGLWARHEKLVCIRKKFWILKEKVPFSSQTLFKCYKLISTLDLHYRERGISCLLWEPESNRK